MKWMYEKGSSLEVESMVDCTFTNGYNHRYVCWLI